MKSEVITLRVTPNEKEFIKQKADMKDFKSVADFILSSLIYPEKIDKKKMGSMLYEVNKIGVNLNQVVRHINSERHIDIQILNQLKETNLLLEMVLNTYRSL